MAITITALQKAEIISLMDQGAVKINADGTTGNYSEAYRYVGDLLLTTMRNGGLSPEDMAAANPVYRWFRGAEQANDGQGVFSFLIRTYTQRQAELRLGREFTPQELQDASNKVADAVLNDIVSNPSLEIPTIDAIAENDAKQVGLAFEKAGLDELDTAVLNNSAWAGAILFSGLGSPQTDRLVRAGDSASSLDTIDDLKNLLFAYDSFRLLQAATQSTYTSETLLGTLGEFVDDVIITVNSLLSDDPVGGLLDLTRGTPIHEPLQTIGDYGIEDVLDMLRSSYYGSIVQDTTAENFSANAYALFYGAGGMSNDEQLNTGLEMLHSLNVEEIRDLASSSEMHRNALMNLSLIAVDLGDYSGRGIELYDSQTGLGSITDDWIHDRASMLKFRQMYDEQNVNYGETLSVSFLGLPFPIPGDLHYVDVASGLELYIDGTDLGIAETTEIIFGDSNNNDVIGGNGDDRLYGSAGNDTLTGNGGDTIQNYIG